MKPSFSLAATETLNSLKKQVKQKWHCGTVVLFFSMKDKKGRDEKEKLLKHKMKRKWGASQDPKLSGLVLVLGVWANHFTLDYKINN